MPLAADAQQVTATITALMALLSLPLSIYFSDGMRAIDKIAFSRIRLTDGEAAAQRNLFHPLHRYDLHDAALDGTLLTAHGRNPKISGTPVLTWVSPGAWTLTQTGNPYLIAQASWDDLEGINRLTELLDQPAACAHLAVTQRPELLTEEAASACPRHTLAGALKDLQAALGDDYEPSGGIAQLVRHRPSGKAVAVLLTLSDLHRSQCSAIVSGMARRGWHQVPLDTTWPTICLTRASRSAWDHLKGDIQNPAGEPTGHRRW